MTTISGFWHAAARLSGRIDWSPLLRTNKSGLENASPDQLLQSGIPKRYLPKFRRTEPLTFDGEVLLIDDPAYPPPLRHLPFAPPALFYIGNQERMSQPCVSIVGARKCSQQGKQLTHSLASSLTQHGLVVVSGLAYGIDTAAHQAATGKTIAVLGQGIANGLNGTQSKPIQSILQQGGLVISEFPPYQIASRYTFPQRNRVIAGLSVATVVVEATTRSGSRITARHALEYGREVMAVPGHPFSSTSTGCNQLIREGALLVRDGQDVLTALGMDAKFAPGEIPESGIAKTIVAAQGRGITFDELHAVTGHPIPQLIIAVESLELTGWVQRLPGGRICARNQA